MPNGAVRAVAAHQEPRAELQALTLSIQYDADTVVVLHRRHEGGVVFDDAAPALQLFGEQLLRDVLRHHGDEPIRALLWRELHVGQPPAVGDDGNRRDGVGRLDERAHHARHIEDLECSRKDGQRFRVDGLRRARFDEPIVQTPAGTLIREKQTHWAGAHDKDIEIGLIAHNRSPATERGPWSRASRTCERLGPRIQNNTEGWAWSGRIPPPRLPLRRLPGSAGSSSWTG